MIHISSFHSKIPKIFAFLSFIINPLFIYLVLTSSKVQLGSYRYLLVSFAVFDILYSIVEVLTPIAIETTTTWFAVFLTDGPFFSDPTIGQLGISTRCGFISLSYAILVVHFVYRYCLLFKPQIEKQFFSLSGVLTITSFLAFHGFSWGIVCETCLSPNERSRIILSPIFLERHNIDSENIPLLTAIYWNSTSDITIRGRLGIGLLTFTSIYSIITYIVLGYKIVTKIRENAKSSIKAMRMQSQLFYALLVQTFIPIIGSLTPTVLAWYAPIFGFDAPTWWNYYVCTFPLAAFPFLDPLAVILFIPSYRLALVNLIMRKKTPLVSVNVLTASHFRQNIQSTQRSYSSIVQTN